MNRMDSGNAGCRMAGQSSLVALTLGIAYGFLALLGLHAAIDPTPFEARDLPILLMLLVGCILIPGWLLLTDKTRGSR